MTAKFQRWIKCLLDRQKKGTFTVNEFHSSHIQTQAENLDEISESKSIY